jgi:hypothetical protein
MSGEDDVWTLQEAPQELFTHMKAIERNPAYSTGGDHRTHTSSLGPPQ